MLEPLRSETIHKPIASELELDADGAAQETSAERHLHALGISEAVGVVHPPIEGPVEEDVPALEAKALALAERAGLHKLGWLSKIHAEPEAMALAQAEPEVFAEWLEKAFNLYRVAKVPGLRLDTKERRIRELNEYLAGRTQADIALDFGTDQAGVAHDLTKMAAVLRRQLGIEPVQTPPRRVIQPGAATRAAKSPEKLRRELEDLQLVLKARNGSDAALDQLIRRYTSFVRLKASAYFLPGGDSEDLIQEGLVGLYKAVRDFKPDRETSFRSFAELCITRQLITVIKTATRLKHAPLNTYVSFSHTPAGQEGDGDVTLGEALPGPSVNDPSIRVISSEELQALVGCLSTSLSSLETDSLRLYLDGYSYEQMAEKLICDTKTIDNALQRVKRKILTHQAARLVMQ